MLADLFSQRSGRLVSSAKDDVADDRLSAERVVGADDCGFGDWLSVGDVKTPIPFIDLAYHAYDARLMAEMAEAIGDKDAAARFRDRASKIAAAFQKHYLKSDGRLAVLVALPEKSRRDLTVITGLHAELMRVAPK